MPRIDHRTLKAPEIFGGNARSAHPYYTPFGQIHRKSHAQQRRELFDFFDWSDKWKRTNKGRRVLPNLLGA